MIQTRCWCKFRDISQLRIFFRNENGVDQILPSLNFLLLYSLHIGRVGENVEERSSTLPTWKPTEEDKFGVVWNTAGFRQRNFFAKISKLELYFPMCSTPNPILPDSSSPVTVDQ